MSGRVLVNHASQGDELWAEAEKMTARVKATLAGMVKTKHGWARPCAKCGSTNFGRPCSKTADGFHR